MTALLVGALVWTAAPAAHAFKPVVDPEWLPVSDDFPPTVWTPPPGRYGPPAESQWDISSSLTLASNDWTATDTSYRDRLAPPTPDDEVKIGSPERIFFKGWLTITAFEAALLTATATAPKEWTGWSPRFIQDGLGNLRDAYSAPPEWDADSAFINYVGHPYAGAIYYNTVRSQGASKTTSFLFTVLMSTQWEYSFESLAEHPSTQDLLVTPIGGMILGELTHNLTRSLTGNGSGFLEKVLLTVLNPAHAVCVGF